MPEDKRNSVDTWAAIQKVKGTEGWKILMERYSEEGDMLLTQILDPETDKEIRQMLVYEMRALGRLSAIIEVFRREAEGTDKAQSAPKHIGN